MREIKFRAWDRNNKKMLHNFLVSSNGDAFIIRDPMLPTGDDFGFTGMIPCIDSVNLMQFTGLHDKNGRELCESDIIYHTAYKQKYKIEFIPDAGGYVVKSENHTCPLTAMCQQYLEIIGNLYENPELLK